MQSLRPAPTNIEAGRFVSPTYPNLMKAPHASQRPVLCLSLLAPLLLSGTVAAEGAGAIDAIVRRTMKAWDVPGVAVVIVRDEEVGYLKGHGVRELDRDEPVTPDTVFPLASCSKAFTTALMAQLIDSAALRWDDPVRKHLPYFHLSDPNADALVTLRDLVSHRTGVGPHDLLWYRAPWKQEEMIRRAGKLPLSKPFRTAMQYQSVMFTAAGLAAASAAGKPWDELVKEKLFIPLGMKSASTSTAEALKSADRASGHKKDSEAKVRVVPWYVNPEPNPAGSINASARDLGAWLQFQLAEGEFHGERLVSAEQLRATHSPETIIRLEGRVRAENPETQQMSYGMGWVIQDYRGEKLISHAGIIDGFRVHVTMVPKHKLGLAILANLHATRMNLSLSNQLVDHLLKLPPRDWDEFYQKLVADEELTERLAMRRLELDRRPNTMPSLALEKYAGAYEHPAYGTAHVKLNDGKLLWEWSGFRYPLEHYHFDTFHIVTEERFFGQGLVQFGIDDGAVTGLKVLDLGFRRVEAKQADGDRKVPVP
jgi:CubicO group peptidase (beta-lactamase class C family)